VPENKPPVTSYMNSKNKSHVFLNVTVTFHFIARLIVSTALKNLFCTNYKRNQFNELFIFI